jgi:hypothetical protein
MSGRTLEVSGSGLRLRIPNPIPCGSPVKIESSRMVMLGEVSRCDAVAEGYIAGLLTLHSAVIMDPRLS